MSSYSQSARLYDDIYALEMKDYPREAELLWGLLTAASGRPIRQLFDVACGTLLHAETLIKYCRIIGVDLSEHMLEIAHRRLPEVTLIHDSMETFDAGLKADAIVCLFSAIGHLETVEALNRTIQNFARQLFPGGVIAIEPWLFRENWAPGHLGVNLVSTDDRKITRHSRSELINGGDSILLHLDHMVTDNDGTIFFSETHQLRMFTMEEFLRAFEAAGLEAVFHPEGINDNGRGIFIATKPRSKSFIGHHEAHDLSGNLHL